MNGKRVRYMVSVVISTIIIGLICWYLFKYFRRHMVMRVQKQMTEQLDQEIIELQSLGFTPESDVIGLLRSQKTALLQGTHTLMPACDTDLLHSLQKKMLMSYITEAKQLRKRGVAPQSNIMRFAYDKIVRLTIAVAELERQLKGDGAQDISEFQKRVDRMKEITRQSIAHYKKRLRKYVQRGMPLDDEKMQQTRNTLETRVKHFYQMT